LIGQILSRIKNFNKRGKEKINENEIKYDIKAEDHDQPKTKEEVQEMISGNLNIFMVGLNEERRTELKSNNYFTRLMPINTDFDNLQFGLFLVNNSGVNIDKIVLNSQGSVSDMDNIFYTSQRYEELGSIKSGEYKLIEAFGYGILDFNNSFNISVFFHDEKYKSIFLSLKKYFIPSEEDMIEIPLMKDKGFLLKSVDIDKDVSILKKDEHTLNNKILPVNNNIEQVYKSANIKLFSRSPYIPLFDTRYSGYSFKYGQNSFNKLFAAIVLEETSYILDKPSFGYKLYLINPTDVKYKKVVTMCGSYFYGEGHVRVTNILNNENELLNNSFIMLEKEYLDIINSRTWYYLDLYKDDENSEVERLFLSFSIGYTSLYEYYSCDITVLNLKGLPLGLFERKNSDNDYNEGKNSILVTGSIDQIKKEAGNQALMGGVVNRLPSIVSI